MTNMNGNKNGLGERLIAADFANGWTVRAVQAWTGGPYEAHVKDAAGISVWLAETRTVDGLNAEAILSLIGVIGQMPTKTTNDGLAYIRRFIAIQEVS